MNSNKPQLVYRGGKWVLASGNGEPVHYIATHKNRDFIITPTLEQAEQFGGRIFLITNRVHKAGTAEEENLPVSTFVKEVQES